MFSCPQYWASVVAPAALVQAPPFLNAASLEGPRDFAATGTTSQSKLLRRAMTQLRKLDFQSDTVQTLTSLWYILSANVAESECIHARKWIAATVADRTSSMPEVSDSHGPATYRPGHQRIREPRVRVWQVLHDESCSGGDRPNVQRQVGRKSVAYVPEVICKPNKLTFWIRDAQADEALEAARKLSYGPARTEAILSKPGFLPVSNDRPPYR
jgi:hypothetical protein